MDETLDAIMEQAQVFASAWSLVGGQFDNGTMIDDANEAKDELRRLLRAALPAAAPAAVPKSPHCMCKDRPADECPGEWEPGCDLGNNPKYVRAAAPDAPAAQPTGVIHFIGSEKGVGWGMAFEFEAADADALLEGRSDGEQLKLYAAAPAAQPDKIIGPVPEADLEHYAQLRRDAAAPAAQPDDVTLGIGDEEIDLIAADGMRNAAGGIYATSVYEFARAVEKAVLARWHAAPAAQPVEPSAAPTEPKRIDWQQKCLDHGFKYWRAPDAHGVTCSAEQATELLADLLGVEVEIETTEPTEPPAPAVQPVEPLAEDDIKELARSAYEEALAFGVSLDSFNRPMQSLARRLSAPKEPSHD